MEIDDIIKSFQSRTNNRKERYKEFCAHCWYVYDKQIKSTKSDKLINKYSIMRDNTLKYIVANEKKITLELSR
tara:strand:+ start:220 stop:438 length:219 start_codon:yes stop_codon:yes gene_type:complete